MTASSTLRYDPAAAQCFLGEELKVADALLLDNGGDVTLSYRGRMLVESSEGRRSAPGLFWRSPRIPDRKKAA